MTAESTKPTNKSVCRKCFDRNWLIECKCGCGQVLFKRSKNRILKYYIHGHFWKDRKKEYMTGKNHWKWNGGINVDKDGYIFIYSSNHPNKDYKNRVREHTLVMEKHIGRYLTKEEVVHHINGITDDNRIENLMLFENHSKHTEYENKLKKRDEKGRFV